MGTAQYLVVDEVVPLVEETEITADVEVHERAMVQTPTPPSYKYGQNIGATVRTVGK